MYTHVWALTTHIDNVYTCLCCKAFICRLLLYTSLIKCGQTKCCQTKCFLFLSGVLLATDKFCRCRNFSFAFQQWFSYLWCLTNNFYLGFPFAQNENLFSQDLVGNGSSCFLKLVALIFFLSWLFICLSTEFMLLPLKCLFQKELW